MKLVKKHLHNGATRTLSLLVFARTISSASKDSVLIKKNILAFGGLSRSLTVLDLTREEGTDGDVTSNHRTFVLLVKCLWFQWPNLMAVHVVPLKYWPIPLGLDLKMYFLGRAAFFPMMMGLLQQIGKYHSWWIHQRRLWIDLLQHTYKSTLVMYCVMKVKSTMRVLPLFFTFTFSRSLYTVLTGLNCISSLL